MAEHGTKIRLVAGLIVAFWMPRLAHAELAFFTGSPAGFESTLTGQGIIDANVLFTNNPAPATTIQGVLNNDPAAQVDISSNTVLVGDGGQSRVQAQTGTMSAVWLALNPANDSDAQELRSLALNVVNANNATGTITVEVFGDRELSDLLGSQTFDVANGNDFLGVIGLDGQTFAAVRVTSDVPMDELRQIRTGVGSSDGGGGGGGTQVPEPATCLLWLVAGVTCAGYFGWRRVPHSIQPPPRTRFRS